MLAATGPGAELNSWVPLFLVLGAYVAIVVALAIVGRRSKPAGGWLFWIPTALERITGIAGWAAAMIGTAALGLLCAGVGFYSDVAWHIGRGRDKDLLTAPHTMIIVGLGMITVAAALGIFFATLQRVDSGVRVKRLQVPWSAIPLGLLGLCALGGFPLDDLWHATYGIDVTMWSPTHMLMICGASFSLIAAWLALAEAGVSFRDSVWSRIVTFVAAWFVLAGLSAPLGEFQFGVPQFQQVFHPVLVLLAAAFAFVATRIVLGRGWALALAVASFLPALAQRSDFVPNRGPALFVTSALAVELVALAFGTDRRLRFALLSAVGVSTIGLAGEFAWNHTAAQPWHASLLVPALLLGGLAALGAAVLGSGYAGAITGEPGRISKLVLAAAAVAVLVAIVLPMPRRTGSVQATLDIVRTGDTATVTVHLDPPDAADGNRWFQTVAWQGGGLAIVAMRETSPGTFVAERAVPVGGKWKTVVRLATGDELMSVPVWFPADPEIGAAEIPAESRTVAFGSEQQYLMREVKPGPLTVQTIAYVVIAAVLVLWAAAFVLACSKIGARRPGGPTGAQPTSSDASAHKAATPPRTAIRTVLPTGARASSPS
ncbi:MAG: hypothetical protein QOE63_1682 [Acidimicrobiaceae bacterium]|jgi:hypothetical protein